MESNNGLPTAEQIKELTEATLLYVQSTLSEIKAIPFRGIPDDHIIEPDMNIDITISVANGNTKGINQLVFEQHEFNPSTSSSKFRLTAPKFIEEYDLQVEGKLAKHEIIGKGILRSITVGYGYVVSNLRFKELNQFLQITSVDLDFFLEGVTIEVEDINADHEAVELLKKMLEDYYVEKYNNIKKEECKRFADAMMENLNRIMSGRSTDQVIQWLKEHTNGEVHKDFIDNFVKTFVKVD